MPQFIEKPLSTRARSNKRPVFGVGINDSDYTVSPIINNKQVRCHFYSTWHSILTRCYSKKYQKTRPTYKDCTISDEWLIFSNFKSWMQAQDWQGKHLDKDILTPDNKHYSAKTCMFVSPEINNLFNKHNSRRGKYPIGVSLKRVTNRYAVHCCINGVQADFGTFDTIEEASNRYKYIKYNNILKIAKQQKCEKLKSALMAHADLLKALAVVENAKR